MLNSWLLLEYLPCDVSFWRKFPVSEQARCCCFSCTSSELLRNSIVAPWRWPWSSRLVNLLVLLLPLSKASNFSEADCDDVTVLLSAQYVVLEFDVDGVRCTQERDEDTGPTWSCGGDLVSDAGRRSFGESTDFSSNAALQLELKVSVKDPLTSHFRVRLVYLPVSQFSYLSLCFQGSFEPYGKV